jgi:hypothetical protein
MNSVYLAIANNLRDFGYSGVSHNMVQEIHKAMKDGKPLPHGIVGMFAQAQLREAEDKGLL